MILVTGASGFVGSAVAKVLLKAGHQVRVLVRPTSSRVNLADPRLEIVTGDLLDAASIERAMTNVRFVFHVAADYRLWARNPDDIVHTNVEGTRLVMEGALRAGVERMVYTSSVATLKPQPDGSLSDETFPVDPKLALGGYKYSKVAAERLVESMIAEKGLPAVIVNPSTPIGPGDVRPTPTGRIIIEAAAGRMPAYVDTGLNLVHVDDVAAGHVAALKKAGSASAISWAARMFSWATCCARSPARSGGGRRVCACRGSSFFRSLTRAEAVAHFTGREPFVTTTGLRLAKDRMFLPRRKLSASWAIARGPMARRSPKRSSGFGRTAISRSNGG